LNEYLLPDDFMDDAIRLEVNFAMVRYTDSIQFGWSMAPLGQFGKSGAEGLQPFQHVSNFLHGIVESNVAVDVDQI